MSLEFAGVITLVVGVFVLLFGETFAISAFILSTVFGSAAAFILTGIGASIQPAHVLLGFLVLVVFSKKENTAACLKLVKFPRAGFWLTCAWGYGIIGAFFFPRLFAGHFDVNAIGSAASFVQVPIGPTSGNLTQSVYFTADLVCFLTCSVFVKTESGARTITRALLAYCAANIAFAALDFITYVTGAGDALDFMRNATYVIYTDAAEGSFRRVIGSFTEASAFASATFGAFAFSTRLWLSGVYSRTSAAISLISLFLLVLSVSSTAYAALPVYIALLYTAQIVALFRRRQNPTAVGHFLIFAPLIIAAGAFVILLWPSAFKLASETIIATLFEKSSSASGIDRGRWNLEAIQTFFDTFGLGAGVGSVRASSFILAVLANLGVAGTIFYGLFVYSTLIGSNTRKPPDAAVSAARSAVAALLITGSVSAALIDLGLPFFVLCALATSKPHLLRRPKLTPPFNDRIRTLPALPTRVAAPILDSHRDLTAG
jgi:hypothetical protein